MNCEFCGWGAHIKSPCQTREDAVECRLNLENARKYFLQNRHALMVPTVVRSVRYQGPEGKGDSYERLEPVL